jgi:Na+/H+ antiporter NhaD/arsenite permease-like protein
MGVKAGLLWGLVALLISLKYHFVIYAYLVMALSYVLGGYYGVYYIRKTSQNIKWLKLLFWSNTFTWILPPIGFFTYAATHVINSRNHGEDRTLYMRLAIVCSWLSFINIIILAKYLT